VGETVKVKRAMVMEAGGQVQTFLLMIITGFFLGAFMDAYRSLLKYWQLRTLALCVVDCMYWLLNSIVVFYILLLGNWGDIRFYVFVGLSAGVACYHFWFKRRLQWWLLQLRYKKAQKTAGHFGAENKGN
jgi:spore cortex biosynthesis protein YabQ